MHNEKLSNLPSERQFPCRIFLLLSWCLGLALGIAFAYNAGSSYFSLMRSAVQSPVSIVGLLVVFALPFLISAIAVFISRTELLIPLAFIKAFSFGTCAFAVDMVFSSAGWLLRILLMFSDLASLPILLWFWLRCIEGNRSRTVQDLVICTVLAIVVGGLDYCLVSPYLAMLL